jgi:hypothetical protein
MIPQEDSEMKSVQAMLYEITDFHYGIKFTVPRDLKYLIFGVFAPQLIDKSE